MSETRIHRDQRSSQNPRSTNRPPTTHGGLQPGPDTPKSLLASCGTYPPPGCPVAPREPSNRDQPRAAFSVSPYITTRRCNSPAGPGLGPHKTSSSRPASNLAHFNIRQIWTISTPVNRHFPFYFHHTTTVSSRQPFLGPHERSTCYVSGSLPIFNPSTRSPRFTHSPPISPFVCFTHICCPFHCAPSHRPATRTARSLGYRLHRCAHSDA